MTCASLRYVVKKIAIQGQRASFHDQATRLFFKEPVELVYCHTFKEVFAALANGQADQAVVAYENSLYGSINSVHDLLMENKFWIIGEQYLRVEFCLIGLPSAKLTDIRSVYSQNFALEECDELLETKLPQAKVYEESDTAGSVELVKQWNDLTKAAIASEEAAKLHSMQILAKNIETHHENYTRFVVLSPKKQAVSGSNKSSLVLTTHADTKPGALLRALQVFADRDINMTMLQSRPIIGKAWHYLFYIDIELGDSDQTFQPVVSELEKMGMQVTVLGSYVANPSL